MHRLLPRSLQAVLFSLAVILLTIGGTAVSHAQTFRGGITGTVTDVTGAAIAGAAVTAVDTSTNVSYKTVSSSAGEFYLTNLPVGSYTVTIGFSGFSTAKYDKLQVAAGANYTISAKLTLSSTDQTVEITAAALTLGPGIPIPNASLRAWYGERPSTGSMYSLKMASGLAWATSSISMPPDCEAMKTIFAVVRSSTRPR